LGAFEQEAVGHARIMPIGWHARYRETVTALALADVAAVTDRHRRRDLAFISEF
jgi:hypothetical protein